MNIQVHLPKHLSANVKKNKYHKVYGMTQKVDVMGVRSEAFFALQQKTQVLARLFNFRKKKNITNFRFSDTLIWFIEEYFVVVLLFVSLVFSECFSSVHSALSHRLQSDWCPAVCPCTLYVQGPVSRPTGCSRGLCAWASALTSSSATELVSECRRPRATRGSAPGS